MSIRLVRHQHIGHDIDQFLQAFDGRSSPAPGGSTNLPGPGCASVDASRGDAMKHALIVAHPNPASFNMAVAKAYSDMARELKHEVVVRDLHRMDFDPRLKAGEIPSPGGFAP